MAWSQTICYFLAADRIVAGEGLPRYRTATNPLGACMIGGILRSRMSLTFVSTASKMVTRAGTFLVVAPIIGPFWQGHLVVYSAWSAIAGLLAAYGLQVKVLREVPGAPEKGRELITTDLMAMLLLSFPAMIVAGVVGGIIADSVTMVSFALIFFATLFSIASDYMSCALRAIDRFQKETHISLFSAGLQFSFSTVAALIYRNLAAVAAALFLARLIVCLVSFRALFSDPVLASNEARKAKAAPVDNIVLAFPYFVDASISVLISQVDVVLLAQFVDKSTVGIYGAGSRFVSLFLAIPWMLTNIVVPKVMRSPISERGREIRRNDVIMGAIACGAAAILLVGGPLLTLPLLGVLYAPLNALWPFLAILLLARFFEGAMAIRMLIANRVASRARVQVALLIWNLLIGVPAIILFSSKGLLCILAIGSFASGFFYRRVTNPVMSSWS